MGEATEVEAPPLEEEARSVGDPTTTAAAVIPAPRPPEAANGDAGSAVRAPMEKALVAVMTSSLLLVVVPIVRIVLVLLVFASGEEAEADWPPRA